MPTKPQIAISSLPFLARLVHLLLDAALLNEVFLQPLNKPDYQGIALVYKGNGDVSDGLVTALLYLLTIDSGVYVLTAETGCLLVAGIVCSPVLKVPDSQIVLIVE